MEFFQRLFESDFMPHGHCYFWRPDILWPHVLGDTFTALAYFVIPILLYRFVRARPDIKYPTVFLAFSLFILCCGITHLLATISVWHPIYRLEAVAKVATALVSVGTVAMLFKLYVPILSIPTPAQLEQANAELQKAVTIGKQQRAEIMELNTSLERKVKERTAQLEEINQELESFSYSVSHDLRAPLKNMEGMAAMLEELYASELKEDGITLVRHINDNARRMDRLIADFLILSRVGQEVIKKEKFDLQALFYEVFEEVRREYPDKKIDFEVQELPRAYGDLTLLRQVVQNLLSNALKYSSRKDEIVIRVAGRREGNQTVYEVRDNGVGFDSRSGKKLFRMFQRLHSSEHFSGHGIGLAISYRVIKKHGGNIWAKSKPGAGAAFFFSLPAS